jgi:formyltetrahydrofolate hydrolase
VSFESPRAQDVNEVSARFSQLAPEFEMAWRMYDVGVRAKVVILVSQQLHCLRYLLYRHADRKLPVFPAASSTSIIHSCRVFPAPTPTGKLTRAGFV